jgi:serine/threonine protein kinase
VLLLSPTRASFPSPILEPSVTPKLGHWLHFELLERLGKGSYGEVFRARDLKLDRQVALKLLKEPASKLDDTQIVNEARLLALIDHPHGRDHQRANSDRKGRSACRGPQIRPLTNPPIVRPKRLETRRFAATNRYQNGLK